MSKQKSTSTESQLNSLLKETEAAQEVIKANTKKTVNLLKGLMEETPEILAVRWSQYTPGFNDGDACEFSVNDLEIKFNPELLPVNEEKSYNDRGEENEDDGFVHSDYLEDFFSRQEDVLNFKDIAKVEKKVKLFHKIHNALANVTGALEEAFGTNVQITVTRKGIEKEDYDCGF